MTQHTPGPWRVDPDEECCVLGPPEGNPPYQITVAQAYGFMGIREANARLIAAAPDMLVALKGLLLAIESPDDYPDECEAARALVARLTGDER